MERRAVIAIVISLLIIIAYQELVIKRFYGTPEEEAGRVAEATPPLAAGATPAAPGGAKEAAPRPAGTRAAAPAAAAPPAPPVGHPRVAGRDVIVDTPLYHAVFTTAGGRLKHLQLKRYRTSVSPKSTPLELVAPESGDGYALGLVLRGKRTASDDATEYQVNRAHLTLRDGQTGAITFVGDVGGARVTKRFELRAESYLFALEVRAEGVPADFTELAVSWPRRIEGPLTPTREVIFDSALVLQGRKLVKAPFKKLEAARLIQKDIGWVAYSGRYFLAAVVPEVGEQNAVRVWISREDERVESLLLLPPGMFQARLDVYAGPKQIDIVQQAGHRLRKAVDLGWFTFAALPLLRLLNLSHRLTGNYGVDIILLTVLIKLLFFPLTQRSMRSMREMQKLQPQLQRIRERLKDKPDEMNKEIMELYRRHKVNPLGGCLPMIVQLPVFIGLYEALLNAVELRHAPFIGWINDLSAPDRLGHVQLPLVHQPGVPVLTLLMGVSMVVQQLMTPSTGDPTQQRIMLIMPVVFTFMFINFPSGLTLYWLVNNILTIAQQAAMNRPKR